MTDGFWPGSEFRRAVDHRTRRLHHRRNLFAAGAATVVIAVAVPLALTSTNSRTSVKMLRPQATIPTSTVSSTSTAAATIMPSATSTTIAATAPPTAATLGTHVIAYEPFTALGAVKSGLHVTDVLNGSCSSTGVAGNSSFRCFSGSRIYDPCFARQAATSGPVLCPTDPTALDVIQLNTGALPAPFQGTGRQRPWAFQLSTGQVCLQVDAAWGGLGPFGCQELRPGLLADCRVPTETNQWWIVECQTRPNTSSPFTSYRVITVWL